nr:hypothetical protein [Sphingomonas aurantiaca]
MQGFGSLLHSLGRREGVSLAGFRILAERLTLMLGATDISLVVEDAGASLLVAVDRGGRPFAAPWAGYAATVEVGCDGLGRAAHGILFVDRHDVR